MGVEFNQEQVNDRAKLMMHRVVARHLARNPALRDLARNVLVREAEKSSERAYVHEWNTLLSAPLPELRRRLTSRDETMERLRLSSPFMVIPGLGLQDPGTRRRIWKLAKRSVMGQVEAGLASPVFAFGR